MSSLRAVLQRPRSRSRRTIVRVALFIIIIGRRGKLEEVLILSFVLSVRRNGILGQLREISDAHVILKMSKKEATWYRKEKILESNAN